MIPENEKLKILREVGYNLSLLGYLGFLFVGNILLFLFLYRLIEKYLFSSKILLVIAIITGIYTGGLSVYKSIYKIKKDKK